MKILYSSEFLTSLGGSFPIFTILACGALLILVIVLLMPMPGVRCPACAARGVESLVLPGKNCNKCNHPC